MSQLLRHTRNDVIWRQNLNDEADADKEDDADDDEDEDEEETKTQEAKTLRWELQRDAEKIKGLSFCVCPNAPDMLRLTSRPYTAKTRASSRGCAVTHTLFLWLHTALCPCFCAQCSLSAGSDTMARRPLAQHARRAAGRSPRSPCQLPVRRRERWPDRQRAV